MKEKNMDHDFPPNLQTDNLYSDKYLGWQKDFAASIQALVRGKPPLIRPEPSSKPDWDVDRLG